MFQRLKILALIVFGFSPLALVAAPASVIALNCNDPSLTSQQQIQCGVNEAGGGTGAKSSDAPTTIANTLKTVLNIMSAAAGVAAVAMLMLAGIRFTASAGSESAVKGAKTSIIYAIIGLVIVALAQVIVHFVINAVSGASPS